VAVTATQPTSFRRELLISASHRLAADAALLASATVHRTAAEITNEAQSIAEQAIRIAIQAARLEAEEKQR
jgi:hypothetical protein